MDMPEELKSLIEKIQEEGVKAADDKARAIEAKASSRAAEVVRKAEAEATRLIAEARSAVAKMEESGRDSLRQAGRDLILTLKKEINATLDRIVVGHVRASLAPHELARIIVGLIKEYGAKGRDGIIITLGKEDLEALGKGLLGELKEEIRKGITLKPSEDIRGGFVISYDGGKSYYDFTDKAIADYIGAYLKPKLSDMLKEKGA